MENNFLIPIGKRIAEIRRSHHMTQEELAEKLGGISPKHVSHTECGTSCFSLQKLIEFCNLFNCSLDYIILGQDPNNVLSKLPDEIATIIHTGTPKEIERLNRYLKMYLELTDKQD